MVPDTPDAGQLPVDTARACLPYWLEAGGWAAALQADAVAAAMGRLPAVQRQRPRSSYIEVQVRPAGPPPISSTLRQCLLCRPIPLLLLPCFAYRFCCCWIHSRKLLRAQNVIASVSEWDGQAYS